MVIKKGPGRTTIEAVVSFKPLRAQGILQGIGNGRLILDDEYERSVHDETEGFPTSDRQARILREAEP